MRRRNLVHNEIYYACAVTVFVLTLPLLSFLLKNKLNLMTYIEKI